MARNATSLSLSLSGRKTTMKVGTKWDILKSYNNSGSVVQTAPYVSQQTWCSCCIFLALFGDKNPDYIVLHKTAYRINWCWLANTSGSLYVKRFSVLHSSISFFHAIVRTTQKTNDDVHMRMARALCLHAVSLTWTVDTMPLFVKRTNIEAEWATTEEGQQNLLSLGKVSLLSEFVLRFGVERCFPKFPRSL